METTKDKLIRLLERRIFNADDLADQIDDLYKQDQALQLQQTGVSDCTHENTSFKHIRCNVCDDCGDVVEIDV
jgi:hypothetical protein